MMNARKLLLDANRNLSPCNVCNADGLIMGHDQAKNWSDLINNG